MGGIKTVRILVDSREKKPLPIPAYLDVLAEDRCWPKGPRTTTVRIEAIRKQIEIADYLLEESAGTVYVPAEGPMTAGLVERKATLDEIGENLFDPSRRPRFDSLLTRMSSAFSHPVLLLDGGFRVTGTMPSEAPRAAILDGLQRCLQRHRIAHCLWTGLSEDDRRQAGEWTARWLINGTIPHAD